jgi:hypothetical protein
MRLFSQKDGGQKDEGRGDLIPGPSPYACSPLPDSSRSLRYFRRSTKMRIADNPENMMKGIGSGDFIPAARDLMIRFAFIRGHPGSCLTRRNVTSCALTLLWERAQARDHPEEASMRRLNVGGYLRIH